MLSWTRCQAGSNVSGRVADRVERDFRTHAPEVVRRLEDLELRFSPEFERVHVAVLLCAKGNLRELDHAMALATLDWRDLLINAGLADEDWSNRLEAELGRYHV